MRLFAALPLPPRARTAVAGLLGRLRDGKLPVRWVADDGLHLTLKFYGEVSADRLGGIEEAVRQAGRGGPPLPLQLADLGAFPAAARPRVFWVGIDGPPALELLQDRVERRSESIGFPPEGAPFRPHVTLGRVREGQRCRLDEVEAVGQEFERVPFLATDLVLYQSVPTGRTPRYEPRATVELGR